MRARRPVALLGGHEPADSPSKQPRKKSKKAKTADALRAVRAFENSRGVAAPSKPGNVLKVEASKATIVRSRGAAGGRKLEAGRDS